MSIRADIRDLFTFRESPVRWRVALQAAVAIGIPAIGFALAGEPELGLLASSGGFTAIYLSNRSRRERARILPLIALGLVASAIVGVLTSGSLVTSIAGLFVVTVVSSALSLGLGIGPPGAMFFVLLAGVSSHLAGPASLGGEALSPLLLIGLLVLGCVISYAVVLVPLAFPGVRERDAALHDKRVVLRFRFDETTRTIFLRIVIAAVIASLVAAPLGVHRAYWVLVAVVVILQNGHRIRLSALRAVHRVLGTLVGVGLFALVMIWDPTGLWLALLVTALQFIVEVVVIRNYGLALVFITPLALTISAHGAAGDVPAVITERVLDTLIGAGIALAVLASAWTLRRMRGADPATDG